MKPPTTSSVATAPRACRSAAVSALLACLLWPLAGWAAGAPEMVFARLGSDDGLAHGAITAIVQDRQGFLWFGTEDGLVRFDGYELRHYIGKRAQDGSLPNDWVSALALDSAGRLWVGSDGGGLVWRDEVAGRFRAPRNGAAALVDPESKIRALHADHGGRLWIATRDGGVELLDTAALRSTAYRHLADDANSLSDDSVFAIAEDASGRIWIGTAAGLDRLDPASGHILRLGARLRAVAALPAAPKVNALFADKGGVLWIGLDAGLARFDPVRNEFSMLRHHDGRPGTLPDGRVTALLEDGDKRLWVGTTAGLALLDRRSGESVVVRRDPTNPSSLPDNNITSLYQDRSGLLWVGTKTGGAARWNPRSWSFGHHRFGDEGADAVTSFAVDRTGLLWVGSFGAGAASIDPYSGAVVRYARSGKNRLKLRDDTVMAMVADGRDRVWLGTMSHGIERVDPTRAEVVHFDHDAADPASLPAPGIMSLLRDSHDRIWVGTYGGGLARIDPDARRVLRYPHGRGDATGLSGDRATALAEDRAGLIWIGTDGAGLNVLDPVSGRFAHFTHDAHDAGSISANTVYAVHVDDRGMVWVGTRGGGLDRVHGAPFGAGLRFENFSENEGLPDSTVYGIESDTSGRLWVSTNRGLAAVQPRDRSVRGFRRNHGLQGDEFNFGAHYRAPDGTLYFGGSNGFNAFMPSRLELNDRPPAVAITEILKLNKPVSQTPEMLHDLDLGFRDSVVTFQFTALDFTGPAENRYAYRLEGFDTDWVNAGNSRQATYTNLDGGDYVFRVRAANNDGIWSETPVALHVHVAPQPWASWWARTAYAAGLAAILFFVWLAQHRRILREAAYARRLKEEVDARTLELAQRNRDMEAANRGLRLASVSDSLTGLGNRRCLHDAMAAAPLPFVLMIVDLDYMKPINDQHGHEGGDAVLLQVAEILRRELRAEDLIVRWGGDEFVVLCRDADLALAASLAERVRNAVAKRIFRVGEGRVARTSCSIGFAPMPFMPGHPALIDWEEALGIADVALYEAKRNRNTWVGWGGTDKSAELPSLPAAIAANSAALEQEGYLVVRRRPFTPEETVDLLRAPRRTGA